MIDLRTGRFLTLMPAQPLLPGAGVGNTIAPDRALESPQALSAEAARSFRAWLLAHRDELKIDVAELVESPRVTLVSRDHIQIYQPRHVNGVLVRGAAIMATIKHGNLMLFGMSDWGTIAEPQRATLEIDDAVAALATRITPHVPGPMWKNPELAYVAVATPTGGENGGPGLGYRLVHVLRPRFSDPDGRFEALIDARNGEVLAIEDTVHHVSTPRKVQGGVFPVSNNGVGAGGVEQLNWPMPFVDVATPGGVVRTDIGGALPQCVDGNITAGLTGQYVNIVDTCGASSLTASGDLNFGGSAGTDCTTPGFGGAGNTHAARTGFHELNMIKAMGRAQLPLNGWLQQRLNANMNVNDVCNAGWNGSEVIFFKSGGGCFNTGELAGVFDHEWGHGMDNNDGVPSVSSPGEGIADIYASLRLNDSCIGPGFFTGNCSGEFGVAGACTACTGVRDIDSAKHSPSTPVTLAMIDTCPTVQGSLGPCGGGVHCEGQVYSQAVWDLWNRDLTAGAFNLDKNVSREIATRLSFQGASGVSTWFACSNGTGGCTNPDGCGCASTSGYQQYLAADDDNGNLADGTPHMTAINAAFARHGIACTTPAVVNSGCASTPTQVPVVTATPGDGSTSLSWTASAGATSYRVYRTDGVFGCDFGKVLLGIVTGTSFIDTGLQNGRQYFYSVMPTGANDECFSVSSTCTSATPASGARLTAAAAQATFTPSAGDGDVFVDNCESTNVTLAVNNIGTSALNNVRVLAVTSPSHPGTTINSVLPLTIAANQASCASNNASISVTPLGLAAGDTLALDVTLTSDELIGQPLTVRVETRATEGDLTAPGTTTFSFDSNVDGWSVVNGVFAREAGASANGTTHHMHSSASLDNQCDAVQSPVLMLAANSTMSLFTNHDIEAFSGGQWWDRANIAAYRVAGGDPAVLVPSGGRLYNATGVGGSCGMGSDQGWGGVAATWAESTFTSTAMQTGTLANQLLRLRMRYGTDSAEVGTGMRFDQVTITNVRLQTTDTQSNVCAAFPLFSNGFE